MGTFRHLRNNLLKWFTVLMAASILMPVFRTSRSILAASDETTASMTETEPSEQVVTLTNPIDGLLDVSPVNLPETHARAYLIYDTLSDTMLIGNEYMASLQPAAITQIMTVMIAFEELELSDTITITKEMYETIPEDYVRIGFTEGEVVTVRDCIHASLLKSANDACLALAIHISGSEDAFVKKMNKRAAELGCSSTHFTNCYGKTSSEHYTSCRDMAIILKQTLRHKDFQTISTTASYTLDPTNKYNDKRVLNNANRFISTPSTAYEYYIGGKTGYADDSGYTIVAGAEKEGRRLVGVMLGATNAEQRYEEMTDLFEYCFANYTTTMIDSSEFDPAVNAITAQIERSIADTPLKIESIKIERLDYYSTFLSLSNGGYCHEIDLGNMLINPEAAQQVFHLPIYRRFSNDQKYKIGYMHVTIVNAESEEVETEKVEIKEETNIKSIILTVVTIISLLAVLVLCIVLFSKMIKRRKFNKNHRNPRIL